MLKNKQRVRNNELFLAALTKEKEMHNEKIDVSTAYEDR